MRPPVPGEAELQAVERILGRLGPGRRALWAALLNAILVDAEAEPGPGLGAELRRALDSAVQAATGRPPGPELAQRLDALITAAALPAAWRSPDNDPDVVPPFALGPNAVYLVAQLRYELGLSVLYAYRQLSSQFGAAMPPTDLLRCIAAVHPSATSRPRRR